MYDRLTEPIYREALSRREQQVQALLAERISGAADGSGPSASRGARLGVLRRLATPLQSLLARRELRRRLI